MSDYPVTVRHTRDLSFTIDNGRTEARVEWDAVDSTWQATELFLTGLGACMLATMMDYAQSNNIDATGAHVELSGDTATRPMRLSTLHITYVLPDTLSQNQIEALVRAGNRCKVHNTIENHPEFTVTTRKATVSR
ncbi:OsmC family protein [Sciscionella marina]|uniref:OsmC family protein n=1 Tax=Sciscionella marina TaxID=508770 RepID=UPI0003718323|nr:OsmC family protein [Sciscionella marina]